MDLRQRRQLVHGDGCWSRWQLVLLRDGRRVVRLDRAELWPDLRCQPDDYQQQLQHRDRH